MPAKPGTTPLKPLKPGMGLYQVFHWPDKAPNKSKPWAVANLETGDVNGRWFASKKEALAQSRALYATLGDSAKVHSEEIHNAFFCFADATQVADTGLTWVEAIEAKTYNTPAYGPVEITNQKLYNFLKNFHDGVRGQDVAINFDHGIDVSKGNKAAGWIKDAQVTANKLVLGIDFTDPAKAELKNKEWRYFSLEWDDEWMHPDGTIFEDVVMGGALTNRPVAKGLMPINFSEIFMEQADADYEFAVWTTAYMNSLPDSSFLFVEPGGTKDSEGKTVPRGKRHFPYKDANGKVDLAHIRNAIARIPQSGVSVDKKALQNRARAILAKAGGSSMSEVVAEYELDAESAAWVENESKEWEHSEPGISSPPPPRTDEDGSDDPAIGGGWRRESPPIVKELEDSSKGGNNLFELADNDAHELLSVLELPFDSDGKKVVESVKLKFGELANLRDAVSAADQEKVFAEQYPQYWEEHRRLMERDRVNSAVKFSESVSKIRKQEGYGLRETKQGLSTAAMQAVADTHKKFAEGICTLEDFEECIKSITNGGIVQFGEIGSSSTEDLPEVDMDTAGGVASARRMFGEVVARIQRENPEMEYTEALQEAARKHPDLAEAYRVTLPA